MNGGRGVLERRSFVAVHLLRILPGLTRGAYVLFFSHPACAPATCRLSPTTYVPPGQGPAWFDEATLDGAAHAPAECSARGICDRETGVCACDASFTGEACQVYKPMTRQGLRLTLSYAHARSREQKHGLTQSLVTKRERDRERTTRKATVFCASIFMGTFPNQSTMQGASVSCIAYVCAKRLEGANFCVKNNTT